MDRVAGQSLSTSRELARAMGRSKNYRGYRDQRFHVPTPVEYRERVLALPLTYRTLRPPGSSFPAGYAEEITALSDEANSMTQRPAQVTR